MINVLIVEIISQCIHISTHIVHFKYLAVLSVTPQSWGEMFLRVLLAQQIENSINSVNRSTDYSVLHIEKCLEKNTIALVCGKSIFSFKGNCPTIFQSGCTILPPTGPQEGSSVSSPSAPFSAITGLYFNHSSSFVMISQCGFNLHFSNG